MKRGKKMKTSDLAIEQEQARQEETHEHEEMYRKLEKFVETFEEKALPKERDWVRLTITLDLDATEELKEILFAEKTNGPHRLRNEKLEEFLARGLFGGGFQRAFIPSEYLGDEGMVLKKAKAEQLIAVVHNKGFMSHIKEEDL